MKKLNASIIVSAVVLALIVGIVVFLFSKPIVRAEDRKTSAEATTSVAETATEAVEPQTKVAEDVVEVPEAPVEAAEVPTEATEAWYEPAYAESYNATYEPVQEPPVEVEPGYTYLGIYYPLLLY